MSAYELEVLDTPRTVNGEGPHWDAETQSLYFVDACTPELSIFRYDNVENKTYSAKLTGIQGNQPHSLFIIPVEGESGHFVISMNNELGIIEWDGISPEAKLIRTILTLDKNMLINDAKVDCKGRLYFGTMYNTMSLADMLKHSIGKLYRYDKDEGLVELKHGISISNGLTWNEEKNKFYYIDSARKNVLEYDHEPDTGSLKNENVLIDFTNGDSTVRCFPDGMTVDKDGFIYVAQFEGYSVSKINPITGNVDLEIKIPTEQATSVAFGGPNLDVLFLTTSTWVPEGEIPLPGGLIFKVTGVGVGLPMRKARV